MSAGQIQRRGSGVRRNIQRIMPIKHTRFLAVLVLAVAAGCSAGVATPSPTALLSPGSTPMPVAPTSSAPTPADHSPAATSAPSALPTREATPVGATFDQPWAVATLTDVSTGGQFRIADLAAEGKVVFVETMAIWCTNCRVQQMEAAAALGELDPARVEWVVIDVETSESADALARYRDQHGFPFRYAISDAALSRSLAMHFGDVVLSPPSVNVIVLGTDGRVTHLLGHHSAADLVAIAREHGA
jgi:thiol-disulfide isomerase/thioredoxin